MIGVDPRPHTLRRLAAMARGRWNLEADVLAKTLGVMLGGGRELFVNPFDTAGPDDNLTAEQEATLRNRIAREQEAFFTAAVRRMRKSKPKPGG